MCASFSSGCMLLMPVVCIWLVSGLFTCCMLLMPVVCIWLVSGLFTCCRINYVYWLYWLVGKNSGYYYYVYYSYKIDDTEYVCHKYIKPN